MVRMMDYLTIDQTMQYLQGRMPAPFDYPQLAQLCRRGKLKPFFAYDGYIKLVHQPNYFNFDDIYFSGYLINTLTIGIITSNATMELGEAFIHEACITEDFECLTSFDLEDKPIMFINDLIDDLKEDEIYCHTVNRSDLLFDRYQVENIPTETSVTNKILHIAQWGEDEKIGIIKDLLPLEQDKTINKLQSTIDSQAKEIAELKAQLASIEQAGKNTQSDTATDKGQGDSLLILGAVMATIEQVAKNNYTQASFIDNYILPAYGHINGISESTLQKKFSQAKTYIKQKV
jgi:hypothetical protein